MVRLIRDTFPQDAERALAIAQCESGLNPEARSHTNDHGLFQINVTAHRKLIETHGFDVYDPEDNVQIARMLYDQEGWRPWVCSHANFLAFKH